MTSEVKIAANRRNASKSTGPRSAFGRMRSRRNAFRHGLAIPINADTAFAGQIKILSDKLAESASEPGQCKAAQMAALAEFELARAQNVKVRMINRAAQDLQEKNCCDAEQLPALAYASQLKALARVDRYERRALSQRNRALRALDVPSHVPHLRERAVCWNNLFVQPVWTFNVNALVKTAIESSPHASDGTLECSELKDLRISVRLQDDQSGHICFASGNAEDPSHEFAITKTHGRPFGRQWVAICPTTAKRVEELFLKENELRIGSRYVLGLTYRSKHSKGMPDSGSTQTIVEPNRSLELHATTMRPAVTEYENLTQPDDCKISAKSDSLLDCDCRGEPSIPVNPTALVISDNTAAPNAEPLASEPVEVSPAPIGVSDFKVGKALVKEGKLDEAFAVYYAIFKADLTKSNSVQAAKQANKALRRIGDLAFNFLLVGRWEQALKCVDEALAAHPKSVNLAIRRAHALMFLGSTGEARAIYRRHLGKRLAHSTFSDSYIQNDFYDLRDAGHSHPLMDEIDRRIFAIYEDKDFVDDAEPLVETGQPAAEEVQAQVAATLPVDIELGDRLLGDGKLDEACISYRRSLTSSQARIAEGGDDAQAQVEFDLAVSRIGVLAFEFLLKHSIWQALDTIEEAMSYRPDWVWLRKIRAYALMLCARISEARSVHSENCSLTLEGGETWGASISADFEMLRAAGYKLPIIDDFERQFASKK